eukprot:gnl/MRDRNA2_/MRDRNA2_65832_c0_seq1.p1 gnl/MRDRNA2_/MRDRNA2_65832_c0~~gnl/MRDRNA2_/MRDRNA2_65832_c0_seq1.p1  ORF type:complete len:262 (-),score=56.69 gnl/MRDRNA2_/MRDRNA2_65832_c0_seq1:507-1259(-)
MGLAGWKDVELRAIFITLDPMKKGYLDMDSFRAAALFEGIHILELWQKVRDALLKRFGTVKKAFKALDGNKSASWSYEEFQKGLEVLDIPAGYMLKSEMFFFIDQCRNGVLTYEEVDVLQNFDALGFMRALLIFREQLVHKFGDLETAFEKLDASGKVDGSLSFEEFQRGCQKIKWSEFCDIDSGLLFHFLDRSHKGQLRLKEWLSLKYFNPPRATEDSRKHRLFLSYVFGTEDPKKAFLQFQARVNQAT